LSLVAPSKLRGEAPRISEVMVKASVAAFPMVVSPLARSVSATVKAPLFVVVMPVRPSETEVAFVVPRLRAAAESTVKAPAAVDQVAAAAEVKVRAPVEVDQVEAAPAVKVRAPADVNEEAPVGVRFTEPAPEAVKFPEVRVKAMSVVPAVVIVAPALYADCKVAAEVTHVAQPMSPAALSVIGPVAETATVPEAFGKVIVLASVGSVMAKVV